ncbi:MAG TPA: GxxExxY protein [Blastocatellia bacterium]|nr:GxxExxY protein [Blastocatellia bacterium]
MIFKEEVFAIVGAAMEVHSELGVGFLEPVYHAALIVELTKRAISFESEKPLAVYYKGGKLPVDYKADLICYGEIVVELKALDRLTSKEESQLLNYLKATNLRVGVLINFGSRGRLEWKRFAN